MRILTLLLAIIPGQFIKGQYVAPYPDNSPSIEDFYSMGVPSFEKVWSLEDYLATIDILDEIYEQDKLSLPRYESEYSGKLFERMVAFENFNWLNDQEINIGQRIIAFEKYKNIPERITLYYVEDHEDVERFGSELLECYLLEAHVASVGKQLYDELKIQIGNRAHMGNFTAGYEAVNQRHINGVEQLILLLEDDYLRFDESALNIFANKLYYFISNIKDETIRKQLKQRIKELDRAPISASIKQIIHELKQQL